MKALINPPAIYLYRHFVDFRKSINVLAALVESETTLALDSGALFLFTTNNAIKSKYCTGTPRALPCGINGSKKTNLNGWCARIIRS